MVVVFRDCTQGTLRLFPSIRSRPLSGTGLGSPATSGQVIPGLTTLTTRSRLPVGRITPNLIPLVSRWIIPKHPGAVRCQRGGSRSNGGP